MSEQEQSHAQINILGIHIAVVRCTGARRRQQGDILRGAYENWLRLHLLETCPRMYYAPALVVQDAAAAERDE